MSDQAWPVLFGVCLLAVAGPLHCEEFLVSVSRGLVCDIHGDHTWLPDGLSLESIRFQITIFILHHIFRFFFFSFCASVGRLVSFQDP